MSPRYFKIGEVGVGFPDPPSTEGDRLLSLVGVGYYEGRRGARYGCGGIPKNDIGDAIYDSYMLRCPRETPRLILRGPCGRYVGPYYGRKMCRAGLAQATLCGKAGGEVGARNSEFDGFRISYIAAYSIARTTHITPGDIKPLVTPVEKILGATSAASPKTREMGPPYTLRRKSPIGI